MTAARRRALLFTLLAVALGWSGWLALNEPAGDSDIVELAKPARPGTPAMPPPVTTDSPPRAAASGATATRLAAAAANLFPEQTWYVPPPPPPPPPYVPPPPPQAPALPYAYMGRWLEGGETVWYLVRGNLPLAVRAGQTIDGVWRLEEAGTGTLNFTYLPLNQTRSLRTGD